MLTLTSRTSGESELGYLLGILCYIAHQCSICTQAEPEAKFLAC